MKFEVTSFNTFEVMPLTRFRDTQMDGQTDGRTVKQGDSSVAPKLHLWGYKNNTCPQNNSMCTLWPQNNST